VSLTLGEAAITLLPAARAEYEQSNDYSIMAELVYGENTFLFAGDAEAERLAEYLASTPMQDVDVLKVPHHGRESALSAEFFAYVKPAHAVITCEEKEMPEDAVVAFLNTLDTKVFGTLYGTVTVKTNGTELQVMQ
jgi:beta-lactamase superfamily II metal-dependent hydrolase